MKKLKPITRPLVHVYKVEFGLNGTFKQAESFHNTMKRITSRFTEMDDFHGSIRVITENAEGSSDKWIIKVITPPIPKNHRLIHALGGMMVTAFEDKRVYSMTDALSVATFKVGGL